MNTETETRSNTLALTPTPEAPSKVAQLRAAIEEENADRLRDIDAIKREITQERSDAAELVESTKESLKGFVKEAYRRIAAHRAAIEANRLTPKRKRKAK